MVAIILLVAMKLRIISLLLPLVSATVIAWAGPGDNLGTVTTISGRSYLDCRIIQVDPDGLVFSHKTGMAKVLFSALPEEQRARLGYDPEEAANHANEPAEKKRRAHEQR